MTPITEGLPDSVTLQLQPNEVIYYYKPLFFVTTKSGGCSGQKNSKTELQTWIAFSGSRVLYQTGSKEGILPFEKISHLEIQTKPVVKLDKKGRQVKAGDEWKLVINSSGAELQIQLPAKETGYEIRNAFTELTSKA